MTNVRGAQTDTTGYDSDKPGGNAHLAWCPRNEISVDPGFSQDDSGAARARETWWNAPVSYPSDPPSEGENAWEVGPNRAQLRSLYTAEIVPKICKIHGEEMVNAETKIQHVSSKHMVKIL